MYIMNINNSDNDKIIITIINHTNSGHAALF